MLLKMYSQVGLEYGFDHSLVHPFYYGKIHEYPENEPDPER